jgi:tetratricopeptide (TPR) repeat protein
MVVSEPDRDGDTRYRLLETLRQYAWQKLQARGEAAAIQQRHATYYTQLAQTLVQDLIRTFEYLPYFRGLERDLANVRATLQWYLDQNLVQEGVHALGPTADYWHLYGSRHEGLTWFQRFLDAAEKQRLAPFHRAALIRGAEWYRIRLGELDAARVQVMQAIELARESAIPHGIAQGLTILGWLLLDRRDLAEAEAALREGLRVAQESGIPVETERAYILLGDLARLNGDLESARACYQAGLEMERPFFGYWAQRNLGYTALHAGNLQEAETRFRTSLAGYQQEQNRLGLVECLAGFAAVAAARGEFGRAAELVGAAESGIQHMGGRLYFGDRFELEATLAKVRARLSAEDLAAALARGRAKPVEVAIAEALESLGRVAHQSSD